MNKLLERWIAALRSGEYKQATYALYKPATEGYCCLGVLEMVAQGEVETREDGSYRPMPTDAFWKRVQSTDCDVLGSGCHIADLIGWNDGGTSFAEIADRLEKGAKEHE